MKAVVHYRWPNQKAAKYLNAARESERFTNVERRKI